MNAPPDWTTKPTTKRTAILNAGLDIFAHDGYARASVERVADAAHVSTRTVYNHFTDKSGLFAAVVEYSSASVSATHIDLIDRHLGSVEASDDLEPALVNYAISMHSSVPPDAPHWRLIAQLQADRDHVSPELIATWRQNGPARTRRQMALHLSDLARRGLLDLDSPELAASHLAALINSSRGDVTEPEPSDERVAMLMRCAVTVFLRGYARSPGD